MKDISKLTKKDLENIKLIILDVDGVVVPRGTIIEQEGQRTMFETKQIRQFEIDKIKELSDAGFEVNISSGRALFMLMDMFQDVLPWVSITYENGSATWEDGSVEQHCGHDEFKFLYSIRDELKLIKDKKIKGWEPKEFIITIHCTSRVPEIEKAMSKYEGIYCIWNGEAYDIGCISQTKANGVKHLMKMYDLKKENILAIGDNYNDRELLETAGLAISADAQRVDGDYYVPMAAGVLMWKITQEKNGDAGNTTRSD